MNIGLRHSYDDLVLVAATDAEWEVKLGDWMIFSHGEMKETTGQVVFLDRQKLSKEEILLAGKILRKANEKDLKRMREQHEEAGKALRKAREKVVELGLPMQIVEARLAFDGGEVNFLFTAEERIDFKEIVPRLAGVMQKRIHLQQLGMRDRAKATDGFGICGRQQCCSSGVLSKFQSVTMEMVKSQELVMKGADKLSGPCGKLLCCLAYELEEYERLRKNLPNWGSSVKTEKGEGKVIALDILNQTVKVALSKGGTQVFTAEELKTGKKVAR
ncbi:MAG: regulatory iron-sulfur-containing complex subunit RicT [Patescibacteria group bacterium]